MSFHALQGERLLAEFINWYRETEARAKAHPRVWSPAPYDLRERVAQMVREIAPDPLPCPCKSCQAMRAGASQK